LRNIKSPIVVFCSHGDDITPPQQALDWLLDLYANDDDIVANGQTIVYSLHDHIGHLGIFVSASVATKEHLKFISNIDMIEMLPPGLYQAKFTSKETAKENADLASGDCVVHFEKRTLDDIRALGCNDEEDDRRFETVARLSENLQGFYDTFFAPAIRAASSKQTAAQLRNCTPRASASPFFRQEPSLRGAARAGRAGSRKQAACCRRQCVLENAGSLVRANCPVSRRAKRGEKPSG
jgi:hypothetical protein